MNNTMGHACQTCCLWLLTVSRKCTNSKLKKLLVASACVITLYLIVLSSTEKFQKAQTSLRSTEKPRGDQIASTPEKDYRKEPLTFSSKEEYLRNLTATSAKEKLIMNQTAFGSKLNLREDKVSYNSTEKLQQTQMFNQNLSMNQLASTSGEKLQRDRRTEVDSAAHGLNLVSTAPRKMLIYVCYGRYMGCAGWSDRQRTLVGTFLLSIVTNRQFGILLKSPCDVRNFYMPNQYNWSVNEAEMEGRNPRVIYPNRNLSRIDFNRMYPEDVLYARGNQDCFYKIQSNPFFKPFLPDWAKKRYPKYFHNGWNILMKPTPKVQQRLDDFLKSVNYHNSTKPLVGVHLRMGKNPSNPSDHRLMNVSRLDRLWPKLERFVKDGSQLFLATDSQQVRELARQRFGPVLHDTNGVILHVGLQKREVTACQGFEDAILDQLVLSYCHVLITSGGGFGRKASYMGMRAKKRYSFQGKFFP